MPPTVARIQVTTNVIAAIGWCVLAILRPTTLHEIFATSWLVIVGASVWIARRSTATGRGRGAAD